MSAQLIRFDHFKGKPTSFIIRHWARFSSLFASASAAAVGGIAFILPEAANQSKTISIAVAAVSIALAMFWALIEYPLKPVEAALPFLRDYRFRAAGYFITGAMEMAAFPMQLSGFFHLLNAVQYLVAHLRNENGDPLPEKKGRR